MREARVLGTVRTWPGAVEVEVSLDGASAAALAYPALVGTPVEGDVVLLNTSAVDLGLGTGGYHLVVAIPGRLPPDAPGPGHIVKARYTPHQAAVLGVSEESSPYAAVMAAATSVARSEEHTSELQSRQYLVCRLLLEKKKKRRKNSIRIRRD